ncbi:ATP-dependent DNA helicase [Pseudoalteromonas denitrificans]|uniref:Helix-hairpin-helix containing domain-containing protein n=1 Tax=Pseudoalteromonas denitrificans DSM 6059 TaxID=1123010 RepID=A0A1I1PKI2_9GAMM|nr:ATP-dependent RecD-like DNA helicase [Pseudoalteromonas denitrificans]SFD10157.1 Helix-hairpin-helix containing domain-containing protein [Pseudoalteromonas denitrificans DSM 6059]
MRISGVVKAIVYESKKMQVISFETKGENIKVVSWQPYLFVELHDYVSITGEMEFTEYGSQLVVSDADYTPPTHALISDFVCSTVGVGSATADRLLVHFNDNLINRIESHDVDALCAVPRVSRALATAICNKWTEQTGKVQLIQFMQEVLSQSTPKYRNDLRFAAKKAYQAYSDQTVKKLKEDPFRIWAFSDFKKASCFANAMGILDDDPRRLMCAVEEVLYSQLNDGNTVVKTDTLLNELSKLLKDGTLANNSLDIAIADVLNNGTRIAITNINDNPKFALATAAIMENYVAEQLRGRINNNPLPIIVSDSEIDKYLLPSKHNLSTEQKNAVQLILNNAVTLVSGGAGTGKTSVLYCVNEMIKMAGNNVLQVALSGKASQRLMQQTADDAFTIASLLNKVDINPDFLDAYTMPVVHIDEASMVDLQSMYRLLQIFEGRPLRLVFIGDWAQLPPVGAGLIFHKLMHCKQVCSIELTENFRSHSGINTVAQSIKNGVLFDANKNVEIIEYAHQDELLNLLEHQYYINTYNNNEAHIIAPLKSTVAKINTRIHKSFSQNRVIVKISQQFRIGDVVIYKKNNKHIGLVNGSTGVIIGQTDMTMVVNFGVEGIVYLNIDEILDNEKGQYFLQFAYALTCHSSQGSEFDTAIVVVEDFKMVERSWLYTAVTRAKKKVVILTPDNAILNVLNRGFAFEQIQVGFEL